jgi:hypothetical protein
VLLHYHGPRRKCFVCLQSQPGALSDLSFGDDDRIFGWRRSCRLRGTFAPGRSGGKQCGLELRGVHHLRGVASNVLFSVDGDGGGLIGCRCSINFRDSGGFERSRRRGNGLHGCLGALGFV